MLIKSERYLGDRPCKTLKVSRVSYIVSSSSLVTNVALQVEVLCDKTYTRDISLNAITTYMTSGYMKRHFAKCTFNPAVESRPRTASRLAR